MRIHVYHLIRKLHLYTAFSVLGFVFMYFVTGFILIHEDWFLKSKPTTLSSQYTVHIPDTSSLEKIASYVEEKFDIHAKKERIEKNIDGNMYLEYSKPGGSFVVTILPGRANVIVKTTQFTAAGTMVGFHRVHGYGGGWLYNLYVLMMDLASIATILFGLTGLYLWYKLMRKKRKWGIIILIGSLGYAIMIILWLMNN